jgi:hypothetical protein
MLSMIASWIVYALSNSLIIACFNCRLFNLELRYGAILCSSEARMRFKNTILFITV